MVVLQVVVATDCAEIACAARDLALELDEMSIGAHATPLRVVPPQPTNRVCAQSDHPCAFCTPGVQWRSTAGHVAVHTALKPERL